MSQLRLIDVSEPELPARIDLKNEDVAAVAQGVEGARLVFADPPWSYSNNGDKKRAAESKYGCLSMSEIVAHLRTAFDVSAAADSYLVLWVTFPLLAEWMKAATPSAIGWEYVTGGAWVKNGAPGVGFHWRGNSELALIYRKGKPRPVNSSALKSCHVSNSTELKWMAHSEKPIDWQHAMIHNWAKPDDLVFDIYAGLGSVALACLRRGCRYIGAEIDPARYRKAVDRVALYRRTPIHEP